MIIEAKRTLSLLSVAAALFWGCTDPPKVELAASRQAVLKHVRIERFPDSPLSTLLHFQTAEPVQVSITIVGQDGEDLEARVDGYHTDHTVPVHGLYPACSTPIVVRLEGRAGGFVFDTVDVSAPELPPKYRNLPITVVRGGRRPMAPGFTLILLSREYGGSVEEGMFLAVDKFGKVRWVYTGDHWFLGKVFPDQRLVVQRSSRVERIRYSYNSLVSALQRSGWASSIVQGLYWKLPESITSKESLVRGEGVYQNLLRTLAGWLPNAMHDHNELREIDLFGRVSAEWAAEGHSIHHDFIFLPNGNLLALASTRSSDEDRIIEIDGRSSAIVREIDLKYALDVDRPQAPRHLNGPDWLHANALYYDRRDSTIVVSARNQSAVFKLTLDSLHVRWILGNHDRWSAPFRNKLLRPVGGDLEWPWGQHAPVQDPAHPDRILLFDNGNLRSYDSPLPPRLNSSRAVEYAVDEQAGTVRQLWQFGRGGERPIYTPVVGNAEYLPNGNRLICFGAIARDLEGNPVEWTRPTEDPERSVNRNVKCSIRIVETTGGDPGDVLFDLSIEDANPNTYLGYFAYRAHRISFY